MAGREQQLDGGCFFFSPCWQLGMPIATTPIRRATGRGLVVAARGAGLALFL